MNGIAVDLLLFFNNFKPNRKTERLSILFNCLAWVGLIVTIRRESISEWKSEDCPSV